MESTEQSLQGSIQVLMPWHCGDGYMMDPGELDRPYRPLNILDIVTQGFALGALRPGLELGRAFGAPKYVA